jgi:hypothetical protein
MDGRVLFEALEGGSPAPAPNRQKHEAERPGFRQELQISAVGMTKYVDWGNRL